MEPPLLQNWKRGPVFGIVLLLFKLTANAQALYIGREIAYYICFRKIWAKPNKQETADFCLLVLDWAARRNELDWGPSMGRRTHQVLSDKRALPPSKPTRT